MHERIWQREVIQFFLFLAVVLVLSKYLGSQSSVEVHFSYIWTLFQIPFVLLSRFLRWHRIWSIWVFLFPLSFLLLFADAFLSLGIASVPAQLDQKFVDYLEKGSQVQFLLLVPIFLGISLQDKSVSLLGACLWVGILAVFCLFLGFWDLGLSLQYLESSSYRSIFKIPYFIIPSILLLQITSFLTYEGLSDESIVYQWLAGILVMLQFIGSLGFFYLVFELL